MDFDEYQKEVGVFADYPAGIVKGNTVKLFYPVLGLAEEVSEFHEKRYSSNCDTVEIIKELGDICWFVQEIATCIGMKMSALSSCTIKASVSLDVLSGRISGILAKTVRDNEGIVPLSGLDTIRSTLALIISKVHDYATQYGVTIQDVMEKNYNKLSSRKLRGVIHGSGDNR